MVILAITFDPAIIAGWLFAGLGAAWLATKMTEEPSYGSVGDLILGGVGGLLGGLTYAFIRADSGFWGGAMIAAGAAVVLICAARFATSLRRE